MATPQSDPPDPDLLQPVNNAAFESGTPPGSEPLCEQDESSRVQELGTIQDHEEIEKALGRQADAMLVQQANDKDKKRLEKAEQSKQ